MPKGSKSPLPPRLPAARALRRLAHVALEDDAAYADAEILGRTGAGAARKVSFERVVVRGADLTGTRLDRLTLMDARLQNCDLANAVWRGAAIDRAELIGCRVTGLDVAEMTASSVVFRDCAVSLASFRFATLKRATFEGCTLTESDFQDATLVDTVFRRCDLRGAVFYGATVGGADFRGSTLDDLKIRAGDLAGAVIDSVQLVTLARTLASLAGIVVRDP
jgi:uncharacterized protein YjbI with pentapeptide repeats